MKVTKTKKTKTNKTTTHSEAVLLRLTEDNKEFLFKEGYDLSLKTKKSATLAGTTNHIIAAYKAIKKDNPKLVEKYSPATL